MLASFGTHKQKSSFPPFQLSDELVSQENEQQLSHAIAGTAKAVTSTSERDLLIMKHLPDVRFIARRVAERLPQHVELEELVSAGMVGLIDAATKFDANKKVQFKSYAQFRIRGAILDSLRQLDWSPRELRRKGREIAEASRKLSQVLGRVPLDAEIAEELSLDLTTYQQLAGELKNTDLASLHEEHTDDTGEEEIAFVACLSSEDPLARCIDQQSREKLKVALEALPEKERIVLTLSYYEELTLKEVGTVLGVVESRVCQIRSSAIKRLRKLLTVPTDQAKTATKKTKVH